MVNLGFLRALLTLSVSVINLFFKIKNAKVARVFKRRLAAPMPNTLPRSQQSQPPSSQSPQLPQPPASVAAPPVPQTQPQPARLSRLSQFDGSFAGPAGPSWRRSIPLASTSLHTRTTNLEFHQEAPGGGGPGCEYAQHSATSQLPQIDFYIRLYYRFSHLANWYLLIKNILVCLLRLEALANWRYLDCFVLGRFIVNGRVIELASYCGVYLLLMRIIWRYIIDKMAPEIRLPFIEFLLTRREHEPFWSSAEGQGGPASSGHAGEDSRGQGRRRQHADHHSALLEFWNPFEMSSPEPSSGAVIALTHKLRPNRTRAAWDTLAAMAARYYSTFFVIWGAIIWAFVRMGVPVVVTKRGFAYSYRYCIQWIQSQSRNQSRSGSVDGVPNSTALANKIYSLFLNRDRDRDQDQILDQVQGPARELLWSYLLMPLAPADGTSHTLDYARPIIIQEIFMPFTDLVRFDYFHLARISLEMFESVLTYVEVGLHFNSAYFIVYMVSRDISLYCRAINARLERLIGSFRRAPRPEFVARRSHYYDMLHTGRNSGRYGQAIRREMMVHEMKSAAQRAETSEIQAMIADLFITIDTYNEYISIQSVCLISAWLIYSALVSSWIFLPGQESPKTEWYVIHAAATLYLFISLASISEATTKCRRLYNLITVAMALDENFKGSKGIWVSLLKFYSPRPLYCFTMMGTIEITYMLGIKLIVWLFSALIVASSFFQVYNIK